jgi:mono/diheme cytochrome c family protein
MMMPSLGLAALLAVTAPAATVPAKMDPAAAAKGRTTFVRYCVACHGMSAKGDGPLAKDLRVGVPDLTEMAEGGVFPYQRVVDSVAKGSTVRGHGTDDMPAWGPAFNRTSGTGAVTVDQAIHHLAHYIWSIQRK